ncbi:hypothetical protein EDB89DRAFT_1901143 [Lactarius sanguifluus]|nr:hypothetical protein EDB89DRAFT_1901143 [Lactarius sanguifluus]
MCWVGWQGVAHRVRVAWGSVVAGALCVTLKGRGWRWWGVGVAGCCGSRGVACRVGVARLGRDEWRWNGLQRPGSCVPCWGSTAGWWWLHVGAGSGLRAPGGGNDLQCSGASVLITSEDGRGAWKSESGEAGRGVEVGAQAGGLRLNLWRGNAIAAPSCTQATSILSPPQHAATTNPPCHPNTARKTFGPMPFHLHSSLPQHPTNPPHHPNTARKTSTANPPPCHPNTARNALRPATPLQRDTQCPSNHRPPRHPNMAHDTPPPANSPPCQHPATANLPRCPNAARKTPPTGHSTPMRKTLPTRHAPFNATHKAPATQPSRHPDTARKTPPTHCHANTPPPLTRHIALTGRTRPC